MVEQEWRGNIRELRKRKLEWIINNVNVALYDPYNPAQMTDLTHMMIKNGVVHKSNNTSMLIRSTETLVIEARKQRGIK